MNILKANILFILTWIIHIHSSAQYIDSVFINSQVQPDELFVNVEMRGGGKLFTRIDEKLNGDTVEFDLYFTRCYGAPNVFYEDTLLTIQSQNVPIEYNLKIRTYYDTNTIDTMNCLPFSTPWPIDTFIVESSNIDFSLIPYSDPSNLKIFPNPITEGKRVSIETISKDYYEQITIYNLRGEKVKTIVKPSSTFSTDGLLPGTYIVEIRYENLYYRDRLIISP